MLSQQSFEVILPASFSLKGAHQEHSTIIANARKFFLNQTQEQWTSSNERNLRKIKQHREHNEKLGKILSLPPVSSQGGSFPSGLLSDQQLSDFLNFDKLHAVPWLPVKHCAFAASESCLLPVLSSISALALAAGSLFPYLVFCDHAQMLLGKE